MCFMLIIISENVPQLEKMYRRILVLEIFSINKLGKRHQQRITQLKVIVLNRVNKYRGVMYKCTRHARISMQLILVPRFIYSGIDG